MTRTMTLDFPQLRSAVGFDQLFNELERSFNNSQSNTYPPYNLVEINEHEWLINVAVAGFNMENLDITLEKNILTIEGTAPKTIENVKYLHKGIGGRSFRRSFTLADHVEVVSAKLELGVLNINLIRKIPDELQPKKIAITTTELIENK
jgi:molecular chaperone IbpA